MVNAGAIVISSLVKVKSQISRLLNGGAFILEYTHQKNIKQRIVINEGVS